MAIPVHVDSLVWIKKSDLGPVNEYLLRNSLTFIPKKTGPDEPKPIRLFATSNEMLGVPRFFWYLKKRELLPDLEFAEDLSGVSAGGELRETSTTFTLRDDQQELVDAAVAYFKRQIGGIICAHTGFGKSISGLAVGQCLGRKILVLCHRKSLALQWQEACHRFFPDWKTGIVGAGKRQWEDVDVCFAIVQTLAHKKGKPFPREFWREFGTVIVDEVHVFGAPYFASVTPRFACRYILGMSGTVRRKDGLENVFKYIIGNQFFRASQKNRVFATIWPRYTPFQTTKFIDHLDKSVLLNIIAKSKPRNQFIAMDIVRAVAKGRNPLVMSERIEMLQNISQFVEKIAQKNNLSISHGFYIGGRTKDELDVAAKATVVYSTYQLAKEGIDIPRLDTLMAASPVSDNEQAVGRVCRKLEGKKVPIVCDYIDQAIRRFDDLYHTRLQLYRSIGFKVLGDD